MPRPVSAENEAGIEIRRKSFRRVVANFRKEECNHKMEQKPNLTKSDANGLKSLQNRIQNEEIVVLRTDKSSKLSVTDLNTYIEMGKKHTKNDTIISMKEVAEKEKIINGHTAMFIKMTGMGDNWGHGPIMRSSKITKSSLFLQLKDHKAVLD